MGAGGGGDFTVGKGIGDHCDVVQSPRLATSPVENTANCCEKVTSSDHFEPNVQRKAGSMDGAHWHHTLELKETNLPI